MLLLAFVIDIRNIFSRPDYKKVIIPQESK